MFLSLLICVFNHLDEEKRGRERREKRERVLVTLLCLSDVTVSVLWIVLMVPWVGLQCVIVVCSNHTVKRPLSNRPKYGFQYQLSLNAGQTYCRMLQREHSAILSTFIKVP